MPKGPSSAYNFFFAERMKKLMGENNKDKNVGEVSKIVSQEWANFSDKDKAPYEKRHAEDKLRHEK